MKYNKLQKKLINKYQINAFVLQHSAPLIHPYFPMSFNMSAGFIQLEPYIRGKKDLKYTKITTIQKCIRHFDLNKAGRDNTHLTFFDMWGALTLGEMDWFTLLKWNIELLTDDLGIDLDKLTFSVFGGEEIHGQKFEPDTESKQSWLKLGVREDQIHIGDFSNTFWFQGGDDLDDNTKGSPFDSRLCGYQTEIFYDLGGESCGDNCGPFCDCGKWLEISNNLNIQYDYSLKSRKYKKLSTPATETVIGVERVQTVLEGKIISGIIHYLNLL
jgi:alanyl-tRNA synthetase